MQRLSADTQASINPVQQMIPVLRIHPSTKRRCVATALALLVTAVIPLVAAADDVSEAGDQATAEAHEQQTAAALLQQYCFDCHASGAAEANIALDSVDLTFATPAHNKILELALTAVDEGHMPPEDAFAMEANERKRLVTWLSGRLAGAAEEARRKGNWTSNRRLTNHEYNFTMQDLFSVDAEFADGLPADPVSPDGYDNASELLRLSPLEMECYLDSARRAVARYVRFGQVNEEPLRYYVEFEDLYYSTADRYGTRKRAPEPVSEQEFRRRQQDKRGAPPTYVPPLSPIPFGRFPTVEKLRAAIPKLHQQFMAVPRCTSIGEMIVRIRAAGTADRNGRFPRMRVEAGITLGDGCSMDTRVMGEIDVTAAPDEPDVYEFRIRMEDVPTKGELRDEDSFDRLSVFDMNQIFISNVSRDDRAIYDLGRGGYGDQDAAMETIEDQLEQMKQAGVNFLHLDCIEVEMLPSRTAEGSYRWSIDASTNDLEAAEQRTVARNFLNEFMRSAYRRPLDTAEVELKMQLFDSLRESGHSFEQSLSETLTAVLVSPAFLFVQSAPSGVEQSSPKNAEAYRLASKLSYLLWMSPPDEQLLEHAANGSLLDEQTLVQQAERLLRDPRSRRFVEDFCRQWLLLDRYANVAVSAERHPDYDDDLAKTSIRETLEYVAHVFNSDSSALDLLDSPYAFLNDRLAIHYGLDPIPTGDLRKTGLPAGSVRGGLLTQASLLTMNSDGRDSHPIRRGVWLLDRILHDPPPPPPPNVPDIDESDPDFRGLTLKEQIELHRKPSACSNCHSKIDPWGLAFENLDATGRYREIVAGGKDNDQRQPVDSAVELPDGPRLEGVKELKHYLRAERSEQFGRALVHHMLTYALGRSLDYADRHEVEAIAQKFAAADYRVKDLVLAIVARDSFRQ